MYFGFGECIIINFTAAQSRQTLLIYGKVGDLHKAENSGQLGRLSYCTFIYHKRAKLGHSDSYRAVEQAPIVNQTLSTQNGWSLSLQIPSYSMQSLFPWEGPKSRISPELEENWNWSIFMREEYRQTDWQTQIHRHMHSYRDIQIHMNTHTRTCTLTYLSMQIHTEPFS